MLFVRSFSRAFLCCCRLVTHQAVLADCTEPTDVDRKFIISYYIRDFTLAVYEPPMRNSGVIGGQFLKRQR